MGGPKQNSKRLPNLQFWPILHLKYPTHLSKDKDFVDFFEIMKFHYWLHMQYLFKRWPLFTPHYFTNSNDITIFCGFVIISEKIDPSYC